MGNETNTPKTEFEINVGCVDSFIRIFIGISLVYLALMGSIGMWGIAGGVLVVTGLSRVCPGYKVIGLNTIRCDTKIGH